MQIIRRKRRINDCSAGCSGEATPSCCSLCWKAFAFTAIAHNLDDPDGWQAVRVIPQHPTARSGEELGPRRVATAPIAVVSVRSGFGSGRLDVVTASAHVVCPWLPSFDFSRLARSKWEWFRSRASPTPHLTTTPTCPDRLRWFLLRLLFELVASATLSKTLSKSFKQPFLFDLY